MRPEHLDLLAMCGTPTLHSDGSLAIVSVIRPDLASNEYVAGLWSVPLDGSGPPRRLTRGHRDTAPAVSPDGRLVAFLRALKQGKPQLYVVETGGGEPVALTDAPLGAGAPRWSPDSQRIAFVARVPEQGRYGTDDDIAADAEAPRLITKLAYRSDGVGFTNDRRNHLFVLDVPDLDVLDFASSESGGSHENHQEPGMVEQRDAADQAEDGKNHKLPQARQITDGYVDDTDVSWSPDGFRLVFVSDRDADGSPTEREDLTSSVFTCRPDGSAITLAAGGKLTCSGPQWTIDGQQIIFLADELGDRGLEFVARNRGLYAVPASTGSRSRAGATVPTRLTDAQTLDLGEVGSHLSVSERGVIVQDRRRGTVRLLEIDPTGDPVDQDSAVEIAGGPGWHRGHAVTPSGDTIVAALAEVDRPSDLVLVRHPSAPELPRRLTDVSRRLRDVAPPRPPIEREIPGADGYPVHGWAVLPDPEIHGSGPYPVLLNIHGGPYASYVGSFFDEPQVYAAAGYAVLLCNPRGAAGYGQAHGLAIKGAMGGVDTDDILAFLDGCLADPDLSLDADRVGVMGGSYGGYMTAWLTTRTDRFVAAIVERGYLDAVSFVGSSDIGWFFPDEYHRIEILDRTEDTDGTEDAGADPDRALRDQSPLSYVDRVRTPTMVIHSEADWRTPIEQGQRWFVALHRNGVPARLLIFPGEGHEMSRSGTPTHRRDRFAHILRWWSEYLPVSPQRDGEQMNEIYVHGYQPRENERLQDQAETLVELLHADTAYPAGSTVLEAGCGVGAQTLPLARRSPDARFTSVDVSADSIAEARRRAAAAALTNVEFQQADVFDLPFESESFDHVFVCFVLEHLSRPVSALTVLGRLLRPGGTVTVLEGDHGSAHFYPDSPAAHAAIQCQVTLQEQAGGNALLGRQVYPLMVEAGFDAVSVSPRMVYVDSSRPDLVEGFTRRTFTAMIEGVREPALAAGLIEASEFDAGVRDLYRTTEPDGVFCYTFFKGVGIKRPT